VPNTELVTALDLDQWADSLNSQSNLPLLVRRLILATATVTQIAMRAREGALLPGWDGLVECAAPDPHVPLGKSGWEMGTSKEIRDKAQSDYKARTDDPLGVDPPTTTFVFVTPRIWRERENWRRDRSADGPWADIRAYDAEDLETWLERAPSVHVWISELLGREPRDVTTPDTWWETWSSQTHPVLPPSFLLAGRDGASSKLVQALAQPPQVITVIGPSRDEAIAVVCATLLGEGQEVDDLTARALIVSGSGAWDRLVDSAAALILIPTFEDADVSTALRKGHRVVIPVPSDVRPRNGLSVSVPALDRQKAADALMTDARINQDVADRHAAHARRNLLSLRRTLAVNPDFKRPAWSQGAEGRRLLPLVLAGSWSDDSDGDRQAIEALTGRSYVDIEGDLATWNALEDAPLRRTGQTWRVVSKDDAWDLISPLATKTDLERFHDVAAKVLQEPDPALDVEPERRFMANIIGEPRTYSLRLRESLADTAAFLGGYVDQNELADRATGQRHANRLVLAVTSNLNADATGRAWQSLADVLPLLAEASPDAFLEVVEAGLTGDARPVRLLFMDRDVAASFGTWSPHIYLVWALESLCWSSDYLSGAASVLARLGIIDPHPDGRIRPRPASSLAEVFNLYLPQTSVPLNRRIDVLDGLRRDVPTAAFSLLRAILPSPNAIWTQTHRPRWRDWAQDPPEEINYPEVVAGSTEIVNRLIIDAGTDGDRWAGLAGHIDTLPNDRDRILTALETLDPASLSEPGTNAVWKVLVDLSNNHRRFPDADWAMPADAIDRVEHTAARFAPTSLVELHTDLFGHHPRLPGVDARDYTSYQAALLAARQDAVRAVLDSGGVTELLALGGAVTLPAAVGWAAGEVRGDDLADELLPLLGSDGSDDRVAHGYAGARLEADGLDWLQRQLERRAETSSVPQQAGLLLAVLRPSQRLLAIVGQLHADVQTEFWRRMNAFYTYADAGAAVVSELIDRGRPWSAIDLLVSLLSRTGQQTTSADVAVIESGAEVALVEPAVDVALVESALLRAGIGPSEDVVQAGSLVWEVEQLLDYLEREGVGIEPRARLEFLFMPLLQHTRPARAFTAVLQTDPALFAELMSYVYRADGEPIDEDVTPERQALATVGYSVIRSWHTPPGVSPDGSVDVARLRAWIIEARRLLAESKRAAIGDQVIGGLLAYVPPEADGLWPAEPVRDLIQELASADLESGLRTEKFNSRGVVTRRPMSGGELERSLAAEFRGWATRVTDRWRRTGAMLRQLADTYEEWGRREDDRSQDFGDRGP